jgi:hypothetical protein
MNQAPQLELVDLGDAKEQTQGDPVNNRLEENSAIKYRF